MLHAIAADIWHAQHNFKPGGVPISSRMTVVRLKDGSLWLHSPIPLANGLREQLAALGPVLHVVAPNRMHHMFASDVLAAFPQARMYGPRSLRKKRPDLQHMIDLLPTAQPEWEDDLDQVLFAGIPAVGETAWFHKPSRTLILTDLCQWWRGDLALLASLYAHVTGVRGKLAVPRTVRLVVKDRELARRSAARILEWPIERLVVGHNTVLDHGAMPHVRAALGYFTG